MNIDLQPLRALATGYFPVLGEADYDAVHRTYGPAFGPWRAVYVAEVVLAMDGAKDDPIAALTAAARDWRVLTDDANRDSDLFALIPLDPTVRDVAVNCPHGLLVAHGLVRLFGSGSGHGDGIPAETPIKL